MSSGMSVHALHKLSNCNDECCFNERTGECGVVRFAPQFFVLDKLKSIPIRIGRQLGKQSGTTSSKTTRILLLKIMNCWKLIRKILSENKTI